MTSRRSEIGGGIWRTRGDFAPRGEARCSTGPASAEQRVLDERCFGVRSLRRSELVLQTRYGHGVEPRQLALESSPASVVQTMD